MRRTPLHSTTTLLIAMFSVSVMTQACGKIPVGIQVVAREWPKPKSPDVQKVCWMYVSGMDVTELLRLMTPLVASFVMTLTVVSSITSSRAPIAELLRLESLFFLATGPSLEFTDDTDSDDE
jgi:hypothetical protein